MGTTKRGSGSFMADAPSQQQFGLIVAYLLPGFIGLAGVVPLVPAVGHWLQPVDGGDAGFGPPIYALMAATTVGMIIGSFRWLIIDHFLEFTGVPKPVRAYERLPETLEAYDYLIEGHYRFYQSYSNLLLAIVSAYLIHRSMNSLPLLGPGTDLGAFIVCAVLLLAARDSLMKHRTKAGRLLGRNAEKDCTGDSHDERD